MTNIYFYILAIIFGLCWGSFLTVVIWRIDDLKSIFTTRSRCTNCNREIRWFDLIPIISYGILRGRCRHCKEKIPSLYPAIELLAGAVVLLTYINYGLSWQGLIIFILFSTLIITLGYDALHMMIVDAVIWFGVALAIFWQIMQILGGDWKSIVFSLVIGIAVGLGIPLVMVLTSHSRWMGEGDIVLGLLAGMLVGFPKILVAYIIAFAVGAIYGISLIILRRGRMKDAVPFGPFLVVGTIIAFFIGQAIVDWYLRINLLI